MNAPIERPRSIGLTGGALWLLAISLVFVAWSLLAIGTPEARQLWRRFAWIVGAEVLAFAVVTSVAGATRHFALIPALNLIVVGVHFVPLARLFRVPRYYVTGVLFCVIPLATVLTIPSRLAVGHALAWYVVPSLGCGLVASVTAAAGLREAWRLVSGSRSSAAWRREGALRRGPDRLPLGDARSRQAATFP